MPRSAPVGSLPGLPAVLRGPLRRGVIRPALAWLSAGIVAAACASAPAERAARPAGSALPSIEAKTAGMRTLDGFLPVHRDEREGKLWLEVPRPGEEMIHVVAAATGVGSNDIGIDRNELGPTRIVRFERHGPKVLLVEPNYEFRAVSDNPAEARAVEEAFATSVIAGFEVAAETGERVLVDATDFLLADAFGAIESLRRSGQGKFAVDPDRSAVHLPGTRAFPRNTEIEVILTLAGEEPGSWVRDVTPTPEAITMRQRHSFVALPEPGYEPRVSDPRAGFFGIDYQDYATPIGEPLTKRFIARHRLEPRDPAATSLERDAPVEPVEPIVYYLDPGVPEPVRSALLEGAAWWSEAFEAAGWRNAYRVEMLPDTADPLDVRYNVINWVHRATRGWSYGSSVIDPRTGEIVKGHVLLGSLRVRQDYRIAEGLLSPYETGEERPPELEAMALARIRQLSAHEVGHTLGLAHNFAASASDRASVMDYPHPLVRLTADGEIDLSEAYDTGVGEWDEAAIEYGYRVFPEGVDEEAALDSILARARAEGLLFISDADARPAGGAHPRAHLWDNAADPVAELHRMMNVRAAALARFGERAIRADRPLARMEETLVPLYLHHRYQVEAAAKVLGGKHYAYALRGDGQEPLRRVSAAEQEAALKALLRTLRAEELTLPRGIVETLPPRPYGFGPHRELFERRTGVTFDPVSPAAAAAGITLDMILQEQRAARLVEQKAFDPALPGLDEVIDRLLSAVFGERPADGYEAEVNRAVERVVVDRLIELAAEAGMPQVRAIASDAIRDLESNIRPRAGSPADRAHYRSIAADIERFLERPAGEREPEPPVDAPPGSPIGTP